MVELRNMPGYLPPEGPLFARHHRFEKDGIVYVGDESSLVPEHPVPPAKKPMTIDPEPRPFIETSRQV